jgi:hypothetical protein
MPSDRKPSLRRLLWYLACLVCLPAIGWGIGTGRIVLAGVALPAFLVSIYFSLNKLVCPNCGKAMRAVGQELPNCPLCGTPYGEGDG